MAKKLDVRQEVLEAISRYELQNRAPHHMSDDEVVATLDDIRRSRDVNRAVTVGLEAVEAYRDMLETLLPDDGRRKMAFFHWGVREASLYMRRKATDLAPYGFTQHQMDRLRERMETELSPTTATAALPVPAGYALHVSTALATEAVASRWPTLRKELAAINVDMMKNDRQIAKHAEIIVAVSRECGVKRKRDTYHALMDKVHFHEGVEAAAAFLEVQSQASTLPKMAAVMLGRLADRTNKRVEMP